MNSRAVELLAASRTGILAALLLRPEEEMHVRELARLTGIAPGTPPRQPAVYFTAKQ